MKMIVFAVALVAAANHWPASGQDIQAVSAEKDMSLASLYAKAKAGDPLAQWQLGVALDVGRYGAADPAEAIRWFEESARNGEPKAFASLALMHATGRGVDVNFYKAQKLYAEAAKRGEPHGFYGLGVMYARGEGFTKDLTRATAYMIVAAVEGDEEADSLLQQDLFGDVDISEAQRLANEILVSYGLETIKLKVLDQSFRLQTLFFNIEYAA